MSILLFIHSMLIPQVLRPAGSRLVWHARTKIPRPGSGEEPLLRQAVHKKT